MRLEMIKEIKNPEEVRIAAGLARRIWQQHFTPIIGPDQVAYMLERFQSFEAMSRQIEEGLAYHLILDADEPSGYLAVQAREPQRDLFLSKLYVLAEKRGRGLGREGLEFCVGLARSMGLDRITLRVNRDNDLAVRFYEKAGFRTDRCDVCDIGGGFVMDDYIMVLEL
jgi:ribosomal protein S18 acetylase RimI-like enzyme